MIRQIINLRRGNCPIRFGDEASAQLWEQACSEQEARMSAEGIRYAVAPKCSVTLPSGRIVGEGQAVTAADFNGGFRVDGGRHTAIPGWQLLQQAVDRSLVLEADVPDGPRAA